MEHGTKCNMKYASTIFFFIISLNSYSQEYATKKYVDSLYSSFDSVLVRTDTLFTSISKPIDTIYMDRSTITTFGYRVTYKNNSNKMESGYREIVISRNVNGTYFLLSSVFTSGSVFIRQHFIILQKVIANVNRYVLYLVGDSGGVYIWQTEKEIKQQF